MLPINKGRWTSKWLRSHCALMRGGSTALIHIERAKQHKDANIANIPFSHRFAGLTTQLGSPTFAEPGQ